MKDQGEEPNEDVVERLVRAAEEGALESALAGLGDSARREEVAELHALSRRVTAAGSVEAEVLGRLGEVELRASDERALAAFRRELSGGPNLEPSSTPARSAPSPWRWVGVAGALAAGLLFLVQWQGAKPEPVVIHTLGADSALISPAGPVSEYGPIEWSLEASMGGWFVLVIEDATTGGEKGELLSIELSEEARRWEPKAAERESWPDAIEVTVSGYDAFGTLTGSASTKQWLEQP